MRSMLEAVCSAARTPATPMNAANTAHTNAALKRSLHQALLVERRTLLLLRAEDIRDHLAAQIKHIGFGHAHLGELAGVHITAYEHFSVDVRGLSVETAGVAGPGFVRFLELAVDEHAQGGALEAGTRRERERFLELGDLRRAFANQFWMQLSVQLGCPRARLRRIRKHSQRIKREFPQELLEILVFRFGFARESDNDLG